MTLIERVRTLRMFWPQLKGCVAFSLLMLQKIPKHPSLKDGLRMRVIAWDMNRRHQAMYMLTHIDCMVAKGQIDLKVATKLVADQLGRLISKQQMNEKGTAGLQEMIRAAGILPADPPEKEGG